MRLNKAGIIFMLTSLLVSSCDISEPEQSTDGDLFTIHALREDTLNGPETKTTLGTNNSLLWNKGDKISLFTEYNNSGGIMMESTGTSPSKETTFVGNASFEAPGSNEFWALYPYDPNSTYNEVTITTTLPAIQTAVESNIEDNIFISVARSKDHNLNFYNVCGGIKFSVNRDDITSVTFSSNNGEDIAGKFNIGFASDGKPYVKDVIEGNCSVTVKAPEGETLKKGTPYYAVVLPTELKSGLSISYDTAQESGRFTTTKTLEILRSHFHIVGAKDDDCIYEPRYVTFRTLSGENELTVNRFYIGTVPLSLEYSYDAQTWTEWDLSPLKFSTDKPLYLRGDNNIYAGQFGTTGDSKFICEGNASYLLSYKEPQIQLKGSLLWLFKGCKTLVKGPDLPSIGLSASCYSQMFMGCSSLETAPALPSMNIPNKAYMEMFKDCVSLKDMPVLPAETVGKEGYKSMFENCTSLTEVPRLPVVTMGDSGLEAMFKGCTSLVNVPERFDIDIIASSGMKDMFSGCTSLQKGPSIYSKRISSAGLGGFLKSTGVKKMPVIEAESIGPGALEAMFQDCTELVETSPLPFDFVDARGYAGMFMGCTSLTEGPDLPATTISEYSYKAMFMGCTSLKKMPTISATDFPMDSAREMFRGCTSLSEGIPEKLVASNYGSYACAFMFYGCTSLTESPGICAESASEHSMNYMFFGCTSLTKANPIEVKTINEGSGTFSHMFSYCKALKKAPELLTDISYSSYEYMFENCTSLTDAPDLPATNLGGGCYRYMFKNCTSLVNVPEILPAMTLKPECYLGMFAGCSSMKRAPTLPAKSVGEGCYSGIFSDCTSLTYIKALFTSYTTMSLFSYNLHRASPTGTFVKSKDLKIEREKIYWIPEGWTVIDDE